MQIVGSVPTPGKAYELAISNGYAYVADGTSDLQIIDIDPPESAGIIHSVDVPGDEIRFIAVAQGYAYTTARNTGQGI